MGALQLKNKGGQANDHREFLRISTSIQETKFVD
jgi:hypothetical protein